MSRPHPSPAMPLRGHRLAEGGIHIIEALNSETVADAGIHEFACFASSLRLQAATGSPSARSRWLGAELRIATAARGTAVSGIREAENGARIGFFRPPGTFLYKNL